MSAQIQDRVSTWNLYARTKLAFDYHTTKVERENGIKLYQEANMEMRKSRFHFQLVYPPKALLQPPAHNCGSGMAMCDVESSYLIHEISQMSQVMKIILWMFVLFHHSSNNIYLIAKFFVWKIISRSDPGSSVHYLDCSTVFLVGQGMRNGMVAHRGMNVK